MENGLILEAELLTNWPGIYSGHMEHFVPDTWGELNNQNEKKQCTDAWGLLKRVHPSTPSTSA